MSTQSGKIYVIKDGERLGPFTVDELLEQVDNGEIRYEDFCLRQGDQQHVPVREVLDWNDEDWREAGWDEDDDVDIDDEEEEEEQHWPEPSPRAPAKRRDQVDIGDPAAQLYCGYPSLLSFPGSLFLAIAGIAAGFLLWDRNGWFLFGGLVVALLCFAYVQFERSMRKYIISPKRVEIVHGFIAKNSNEVRIDDIRAINVRKPGFIGLLGIGNVEFASAGSDAVEVEFTRVSRPDAIKKLVRRLQDRQ